MTENIPKIQKAVEGADFEALLINSEQNRFYATGFPSSAGELLITGDESVLFIDSRYFEEASAKIKTARVEELKNRQKAYEQMAEFLNKKGVKRLAVEMGSMSHSQFLMLDEKLPFELVNGQELISSLRAVKSEEELQLLRNAQAVASKSFLELVPRITRNMSERDVATELFCLMLRNGADDKAFDTISVNAVHSSSPHGHPDGRKLQNGFLTIDFGARVAGYNSDTTRTICIGEPDKEMEKVYNIVLAAQLEAMDKARPGMSARDYDGVARKVIADAGYGEYFTHSLSHGLGIDVHERPFSGQGSTDILQAGNVVSDEPGIYIPGKWGVRIEDCIVIKEGEVENLCDLRKDLWVILA
ncbi:MAG: aminopeptidase P family protein [Oscillospiraceae bacterium]|nr:aminopeptidase P family protein [Oscillospiraceae bacterium]